jgi:uncharacterized protein (DUF2252 family)
MEPDTQQPVSPPNGTQIDTAALAVPAPKHLSVGERRDLGRAARKALPREAHAAWRAPEQRRSPVDVLEEQAASRLPDLVPVRYGRMLASPFAFFRGSAAIMAMDLATLPRTQLTVQLCGDAHLMNFGVFGSPERELLFDINDFDETLPGPFEWDLKRLTTSIVLAGRANGFSTRECRTGVLSATAAYREAMQRLAGMGTLAVWYSHVTIDDIISVLDTAKARRRALAWIQKARSNTSIRALDTLTHVVDGRRQIIDQPPLVERLPPESEHLDLVERLKQVVREYRRTLPTDRRHLFDQFEPIDVARKVVGVGSVGTRCYIIMFEGRAIDDPLFLQVKEAQPSVLESYLGKSVYKDNGERVVVGQRRMQAASDIFLGWYRGPDGQDFYVRQLADLKGSVPVESVTPVGLSLYARVCGSTLARAHARSGDSIQIAAYLGPSMAFDQALASFAGAYADQSERDYHELVEAHENGRIQAVVVKQRQRG